MATKKRTAGFYSVSISDVEDFKILMREKTTQFYLTEKHISYEQIYFVQRFNDDVAVVNTASSSFPVPIGVFDKYFAEWQPLMRQHNIVVNEKD